jgi:TonB-dependent SusC/RagA subfamily outer membrane receptor
MKLIVRVIALLVCVAADSRAQRPMCIVNGVRIDNGTATAGSKPFHIGDVDPSAIENIEVIKGMAAARIYGPDAVNGVISITTKKGAVGAPNWSNVCGAPGRNDADPLTRYLYAPEFVIAHQEAIHLTDRQRTAIQDAVKDVQSEATDTQFKLGSVSEKLAQMLATPTVDESVVLQQIDQVLALEREVKRAQITLLVRIKNQLTPEQQGVLDKLR